MLRDGAHHTLTVDEEQLDRLDWEEIGDDDPQDRLLTVVMIGGVPHHLEGIAVQEVPDPDPDFRPRQVALSDHCTDILDSYMCADGGTDEAFLTVEINGRQYCLFMTPYRD